VIEAEKVRTEGDCGLGECFYGYTEKNLSLATNQLRELHSLAAGGRATPCDDIGLFGWSRVTFPQSSSLGFTRSFSMSPSDDNISAGLIR
jgi:hypothetical protein